MMDAVRAELMSGLGNTGLLLVAVGAAIAALLVALACTRMMSPAWLPLAVWAITLALLTFIAWLFEMPSWFMARAAAVAVVAGLGGAYWMRRALDPRLFSTRASHHR